MRKLIYLVYLLGAAITLGVECLMDPVQAFPVILLAPVLIFVVLEVTGFIRFRTVVQDNQERYTPLMDRINSEGLNDQQAATKYGWPVVIEMDGIISRLEGVQHELNTTMANARKRRDEFAAVVKGTQP